MKFSRDLINIIDYITLRIHLTVIRYNKSLITVSFFRSVLVVCVC